MKKYLIIGSIIAVLILVIYILNHKVQDLIGKLNTATNNYTELLRRDQDNTRLILTLKEIRALNLLKIDSMAYQLKIRPKTITKIIEKIVTEIDTQYVELDPIKLLDHTWNISDQDECWLWEGRIETFNEYDSIAVARTYFNYENKIDEVFWFKRKKILFLPIGKKVFYQQSLPTCGEVNTREIVIKKR